MLPLNAKNAKNVNYTINAKNAIKKSKMKNP